MAENICIIIATVLYGAQFAMYICTGHTAQAVVMIGYILANIGLVWSTYG